MDIKKIQSDSFMTKRSNYETIESCEIFFNQQYELRLEILNKSVEELKVDVADKYTQLSNRINNVDEKLESKYEKLLDKIDSKYNRVEQRIYHLLYALIAAIAAIVLDIIFNYSSSILKILLSQS